MMLDILLVFLVIASFLVLYWIAFTLHKKHLHLDRREVALDRRESDLDQRAEKLDDLEETLEHHDSDLRHREDVYEANVAAFGRDREAFDARVDRFFESIGEMSE